VIGTVNPVLGQVSGQQNQQKFDHKGQALHLLLQWFADGPAEGAGDKTVRR
jgi:hypothetical protein